MPRVLALEWNDTEARVVVAQSQGANIVFEQAFLVSLRPAQPGEDQPAVDAGQRLATALAARGISRLDALVSVGRTNIELRQLSLPPAPDDELPDMVRFQATREFNSLQDNWPLDFMPIDEDPEQPRTVLAAAIAPELVAQIRKTCETAGLKPRRLILRACAAASLFTRLQRDGPMRVRLLADLLGDEVDLTVMIDRKVIFLRTARLPCDPLDDLDAAGVLLSEIRRTMAAVQNQLGGRKVGAIALCGSSPKHAALADLLGERLSLPAEQFDFFAGLKLQEEIRQALPEHPGRFAPLFGMLLDELSATPPAVDFLHPRRRPEAPSRRRLYVRAGLAGGVVLTACLGLAWLQYNTYQRQLDDLTAEAQALTAKAPALEKTERLVKDVETWQGSNIVWLEELRRLSEKFPPSQDAMLTQLDLDIRALNSELRMNGVAKSVDVFKTMGESLRDETHRMVPREAGESAAHKDYPLQFQSSVIVIPEKRR
ncbi:MAG: type IV pilus biogenesis protein PilM [Thermoguttaceae bacterium]